MSLITQPVDLLGSTPLGLGTTLRPIINPDIRPTVPSGTLRIGGDAPNGLVLVGGAPAVRTVKFFDDATDWLVAKTQSASDGTYGFHGLSARSGYVIIVGNAGENSVIIPGVMPG